MFSYFVFCLLICLDKKINKQIKFGGATVFQTVTMKTITVVPPNSNHLPITTKGFETNASSNVSQTPLNRDHSK